MKKYYDTHIEALRGFAALFVLVYHLIIFSKDFNGGYSFTKSVAPYSPPGHLMVLVFFMISGYVIGLNYANKDKPFSIPDYLKKRFVRLYPIYLFSILITIVLFKEGVFSIIGNLFFTQTLFTNGLTFNLSLWSLNHEVLYYLLAIFLLKFKVDYKIAFGICVLIIAACFVIKVPAIIQGYAVGFLFWLSGYIISTIHKSAKADFRASKFISVLLLLLGCEYLNLSSRLVSTFHLPAQQSVHRLDDIIKIGDLSLYLYCLYALIICTSTHVKFFKLLTWFVYLNSFLHLLNLLVNGSFFKTNIFYIPAFFIITSLIFYFIKPFKISLKPLIYLGSISYAFYVVHSPVLYAFGKISFLTGSTTSFFVRSFLIVGIVIIVSHFLEKKLQPFFKKLFLKKDIIKDLGTKV